MHPWQGRVVSVWVQLYKLVGSELKLRSVLVTFFFFFVLYSMIVAFLVGL